MAKPKSAWGIDIGNRALKAVRVVREADGIRIADFEIIDHENILSNAGDNRETLIQNALTNFVQTHALKKEDVAVGVSGQSSFARFIKLPPVEPKQIPSIVRFEAIQQIPFPLDEVEWSYQLFKDEASPDVEVGIFAMRKELIQEHLKYFTDAGLNVQVVQMNPLAVYNGMYFDERLKGTTMVIDLGSENTDLIIAEGETIWLRSIPIGGNSFTEALVKSFKLRFEKAEDLKRNAATSKYGRQILQAMRPIFADLVAEIQRSIGFYASVHRDSRITKVVALGGTFRLPGLQKYLQQNLQLEVQKLDHLGNTAPADAKLAAALSENILSAVGAYGLALQAIGEAKITSSLLPQAIRRERAWRAKNKWFAAAAACFVVGTGLAYGRLYFEQGQFKAQEATQKTINDDLTLATNTDKSWTAVEGGGATENGKIATLKSLADYREVWENIYRDIVTSVPPPPDTQVDVKKLPPRADREQVIIDDFSSQYLSNLDPVLALDIQGMLQYIGQADAGGAGRFGAPMGMGIHPAAALALPAALPGMTAGAAPGPVGTQRGFLITIHCRTPSQKGGDLVQSKLSDGLMQKQALTQAAIKSGTLPLPDYIFQKVWLVRSVQLKNDKARVAQLKARARETAEHRNVVNPAYPGGGGMPMPAAPPGAYPPHQIIPHVYAPAAAPARPPGLGTVGGNGAAEEEPDPVDPLTGESIMGDYDVTVVAAVALDPGAAAPPAGADQTPQAPAPSPNGPRPAPSAPPPHGPHAQGPAPAETLASR